MTEQQSNHHEPIFSAKRDREIENTGGFWCHACLVAYPATEQSPDPRYCQGCYDFLLQETEMLTGHVKKATWVPPRIDKPAKRINKGASPIPSPSGGILSTITDEIQPSGAIETPTKRLGNKRGRKPKELPEDLIEKLASGGMGSKAIANKLRADHNIAISYKTIQRILVRFSPDKQGINKGKSKP